MKTWGGGKQKNMQKYLLKLSIFPSKFFSSSKLSISGFSCYENIGGRGGVSTSPRLKMDVFFGNFKKQCLGCSETKDCGKIIL